jgi:hypothetical protein
MRKRTLRDGTDVEEFQTPVTLTVKTKCPEKWMLVDLETGEHYIGQTGKFYDWRKVANDFPKSRDK